MFRGGLTQLVQIGKEWEVNDRKRYVSKLEEKKEQKVAFVFPNIVKVCFLQSQ